MGDFAQLPPVTGKPLFTTDIKSFSQYQALGKMIFAYFDKTIIFDQIMRQDGDDQKRFREVLNNLCTGEFTNHDWNYLKQRELTGDGQLSDTEKKKVFFNNATKLCGTNKDLIKYNLERIEALGTPYANIKSKNSDHMVASLTASKAQSLPSQLRLAKECKVILTVNLWKEAGLTNGAKGVIKYIVYESNVKPTALPSMVIVQFPQYIGPTYLDNCNNCVPIVPIRRVWFSGKKTCWRIMLPLKMAYGTTIHCSQGQSLDRVIINLGKSEFSCGLAYTAISRCRKFEYLSFDKLPNFDYFTSKNKSTPFTDRLNQDKEERESDKQFMNDAYKLT